MAIAVRVPDEYSDDQLALIGRDHLAAHVDVHLLDEEEYLDFSYHGLTMGSNGIQRIATSLSFPYELVFADALVPFGFERSAVRILNLKSEISVRTGDTACVYALSRTAPRAVDASGAASIIMDGCVVASNSSAEDAIYVGGSASFEADCLQSSGGIVATGGLVLDCAAPRENAWPLPDPFADLLEPTPPFLRTSPQRNDLIVYAGRYTNLDLSGTKHLEPGLYYVENDLSIKGEVTGDGVIFYVKDGSVTVNGDASLSLSAPTSGDYAGMLFMSHPFNTSAHLFNGNGVTDLNGYLYFPSGDLTYAGNNGTTSNCLRIVADTIEMTGSSIMRSDCTEELGGREAEVSGPLYYSR
ncbi:hypothetical protein ABGN05_14045 [Aquibium sp. LZ166]|uniref:Uncharacterized protein n=1 Tax=Aquibium pacificus TaxID=3153579 RepID=A0ABV3SJ40_9HYPH